MGGSVAPQSTLLLLCSLLSLQALVLVCGAVKVEQKLQCPEAIFAFGDSLSDTGQLLHAFPAEGLSAGTKPYGITFPGYFTGRPSDGKLAIDFIAEAFGFPPLHPYFDNFSPDFKHGINFCASGATARSSLFRVPYMSISVPFYLSIQVDQAIFFHSRVVKERERATVPVPEPSSFTNKGLYYIEIGLNDINYDLIAGKDLETSRKITAPETASNISAAITRLYNEVGARQFLVLNIPPIGCFTYALNLFPGLPGTGPIDEYGCLSGINALVQDYNSLIQKEVDALRQKLDDAVIIEADFYGIVHKATRQYKDYGFKDPFYTCCGSPEGPHNFNPIAGPCGAPGAVTCSNPSEYMSWDGLHLSEAVYKIVAQAILKGDILHPATNVVELCHLKVPVVKFNDGRKEEL